jgi:type II secretory pathway pseudopilin PulG
MKHQSQARRAFSLAEVALAIGVAGIALVAVMGMLPVGLKVQQTSVNQTTANEIMAAILNDLRADVRLPPGQQKKSQEGVLGYGLHGHWAAVATPDTLFFNVDGTQNGTANSGTNPPAPGGAVFRATITYLFPPTATTSIAKVIVSWPAQVILTTGVPSGSVETFIAVNR